MKAILILLNGCFPVSPPSPGSAPMVTNGCPDKPIASLQKEKLTPLTLTAQPTKQSGILQKDKDIGYTFSSKSGQVIQYKSPQNICVWIYDPDQQILNKTELTKEGIYTIQVGVIEGSQTFNLDLSLDSAQSIPNLVGSWGGSFANNNATLQIAHQDKDFLEGELIAAETYGNIRIAFRGNFIPSNNSIIFEETTILEKPSQHTWYLGKNEGQLSSDGNSLSGTGLDSRNARYAWSFSRNARSIPNNQPANSPQSSRPSARDFVQEHYNALNTRNYQKTWNALSDQFQRKSTSYQGYEQWWNSVRNIQLNDVRVIRQTDDEAIVDVELWYEMYNGRRVRDSKNRVYLIWDSAKGGWLFNNKAEL
ncbi:hypothetical protein [Microcystis aeruginosa]|uniref:ARC6 IMS domain-containing protein n=1 Tax=Microcystis aeruginosa NIES-4285 TaxID=2497681 RepID=A0A402DCA1_MICAE|nr:hypothetical protein [Microcystis aeruginosa]GCE59825.1 hypothetical protein MiAbB_01744 [Microcystis aeruginosa NIES-4285]